METCALSDQEYISIHALREEGDYAIHTAVIYVIHFYPRPPRGGRPVGHDQGHPAHHISIHALREEGDRTGVSITPGSCYFYPRPPRGGRLDTKEAYKQILEFLSTPSARRATLGHGPKSAMLIKFLSTPSARRATT